ncbi:MAG: hypothetical protein FJ242_04060 [Nitrospira sp.]|nr:hypothetical protein [Nitrospira sp.]
MKDLKHIILISIDNLRYDCIGYQPDKREIIKYDCLKYLETPTLNSIAEKSICFTQAISTNTYTTASHASILTGLYPPKHGVRAFFGDHLNKEVITLAEIFKKHGYRTILATDTEHLFVPLGLDRGFTHLFARNDKDLFNFLKQVKDGKIFLFVHFFDVHAPFMFSEYETFHGCNMDYYENVEHLYRRLLGLEIEASKGDPYETWNKIWTKIHQNINFLLPLYVKGVSKFDKGRFRIFIHELENLDILNNSLVLIFSDHGEGKVNSEDPIFFGHSGELFDNVIRVPLIISHPDITHKIVDCPTSTVDIFPTVIGLAFNGKPQQDYKTGNNSLVNLITNMGDSKSNRPSLTYSETWRGNNIADNISTEYLLWQRCLRLGNKKFIIYGKPEDCFAGSLFKLNNLDFVKKLRRNLLCVFEDQGQIPKFSILLDKGECSREKVFKKFLREYEINAKKFEIYDLENDPFEEHPIGFSSESWLSIEMILVISKILSFEALSSINFQEKGGL